MKFQCILCQSTYTVEMLQFGDSIECPNCHKKIVIPKKAFDRSRIIGGDFVIDRILGTGGMGTVYLARQISLERDVALKVLARKFSVDQKFRLEFQREARAASRLTHSNLVQAYAFGEDEGDLFLAMEYVEGVTMGDRLDNETRLMLDEALNIIQQVAEGLHFAWTEEQLIHRDIKPDNIMLTPDGHVKLTDMGLARTQVELENVTEVSGTPAYMNPEQFTKQPMDCRADIYSLGVCLYHGVTGQLPFDSPNVRELARQHIQDKLEFPDKVVDLPSELKKLIRKMMNKNREDRYEDHEDLLHDIYTTRTKINESSAHIPNVHTLSFNRYEFKNLKPQRKSETDTQVSSTKQLPRKKIKPLSSSTSHLTTSFTTVDGDLRSGNFFLTNLVAIMALIGALIMAFMIGGDSDSKFYRDTESYLSSITSDTNPENIIEKVDELLAREITTGVNKKDYYAQNKLLEIKLKYLKQIQEKKDQELKKINQRIESLKQENRKFSLLKGKTEEEALEKVKNLENELNMARKRFKNNKPEKIKAAEKNKTFSFGAAISEDMKLLGQLWDEKKNEIRFNILKELATGKYSNAVKVVTDIQLKYSGTYKKWLDRQKNFIDNAREIWDYVEDNLIDINNNLVVIGAKTHEITRVYPQSAELETADTIIKLRDISTEDFMNIYQIICKKNNKTPVNGAAYAVSKFDFNYANSLSPNDNTITDYAQTYVDERILYISRLFDVGDKEKAEELAIKVYSQCSGLTNLTPLKPRLLKIFGRDIILGSDLFQIK
ncbi:MAG: protein kinase [Lentisphaeraceae bacterium]|nr:protein kinase [Lentisphaeraceae bacterium]